MICSNCKNGLHNRCPGGTFCYCQHKEGTKKMTQPTVDEDAVELEDEVEDDEDWEDVEEEEDEEEDEDEQS